jgi:Survival motor neuron (SMN) interacting protein 1 (SIP1)
MAKRKRVAVAKENLTAGPINETTGQRSVFPEVVDIPPVRNTKRDTEWQYEEEVENDNMDEEQDDDGDGLVGQTFSVGELDWSIEEEDTWEDGEEETNGNEFSDGEVVEEWDVEPQTEALAYLSSVRTEAESLPSLTYDPQQALPFPTNGVVIPPKLEPPKDTAPANDGDGEWKTQFLEYYANLRKEISTAPAPNLPQDKLDKLLHIKPYNRPQTAAQEDSLWRNKTLDRPSLKLLSMLDHQRTIHLLSHLRKKLSANMKMEQCIWLVFLLARLGDPGVLSGEDVDLLRRIGKKCFDVRRGVGEDKARLLSMIDMTLCIIKDFYQQKDLKDTVQESA